MTFVRARNLRGHALLRFQRHDVTTELGYLCECGQVGPFRLTRKAAIRDHALHKVDVRLKGQHHAV